ncbi:MAG: BMP family ABC transporter substrate-binding protein [Anaerolineales bacterium]|nr:BMP family ABC transporter substrate-binding protein [Anaerolineales bacterium]
MNFYKSIVFILATLVLASCTRSPACFREDVFCAGLVTDTLGIKDHGVNQDAWLGLQRAKSEKLADEVAYIESVDVRDYRKNINYFIDQGYDIIITSGISLDDETLRAAKLTPDSIFIGINQPEEKDAPRNFVPLNFAEDQMGFLAGALAARLTETGIVGAVCETSGIDAMWRYCEGFRAGVEYTDDTVKIVVLYRDEGDREKIFVDEAWGMEQGQYLAQRGADVIFAAGGVTGQGALRAATEKGIYAIGTERDQAMALAESNSSVVTSIYGQAGFEVQKMMRLIKAGNIPESEFGQFGYIPLHEKFPESLSVDLNQLLDELASGEVQTSVLLQKP